MGHDRAYSIQETVDGGYALAGQVVIQGGVTCILFIKTNEYGDTLWTKIFDYGAYVQANSVSQTADSGFVLTGFSPNNGVLLIRTNNNGSLLWSKRYETDLTQDYEEGKCVRQTFDNGFIICGYSYILSPADQNIYLFKTNEIGDTLWTKTYGGFSFDRASSILQTSDSGFVICGYTSSFGAGSFDLFLVKCDANGDLIWSKTYGGIQNDIGNWVDQTSDGGYIIAGSTESFGAGYKDVYLIKTDANGDTVWTKTYGGNWR